MNKIDKNIIDSNHSLIVGAGKLASTVSKTMGAKGKLVVIQDYNNMTPIVTKDGVTVANAVDLEDTHEMMGAKILREASNKMLSEISDGTTSVCVLANALLDVDGLSIKQVVNDYDRDLKIAQAEVRKIGKKANKKQLKQVATLSANGDEKIGGIVSKAYLAVGEYGAVMVEDSLFPEDSLVIEEGLNIEQGWLSRYFVTNQEDLSCELEDLLVLVTSDKIENFSNLIPVFETSVRLKRPILIIADDITDLVKEQIIINNMEGKIKCCVIRSPKFGEQREKLIQDICFLTGAKPVNIYGGEYDIESLGEAVKVVSRASNTSLITAPKEGIKEYVEKVKTDNTDDIVFNKYRLNILNGKMAIIKVGGMTPTDQKERRDRFDDAVGATRSVFKFGVVPGGGNVLAYLADSGLNFSEPFKKALKAPMTTIYKNAELDFQGVVKLNKGYDVSDDSWQEDLIGRGIVDSTLSILKSLEIAVSVAKTLIQTQVSIKTLN